MDKRRHKTTKRLHQIKNVYFGKGIWALDDKNEENPGLYHPEIES